MLKEQPIHFAGQLRSEVVWNVQYPGWEDKAVPRNSSLFRCFYESEGRIVDGNDFLAVF